MGGKQTDGAAAGSNSDTDKAATHRAHRRPVAPGNSVAATISTFVSSSSSSPFKTYLLARIYLLIKLRKPF
jgi:hypothetical protein